MCTQRYLNSVKERCLILSHLRRCASVKTKPPCRHGYQVWRRGHFCAPHGPVFKLIFPATALNAYLGDIACRPGPNPQNPFKPHSLRIGRHTCYTGARHEPRPKRLPRSSCHSPLLPPPLPHLPAPNDTHYEPFKSQYLPLIRPATPRQPLH